MSFLFAQLDLDIAELLAAFHLYVLPPLIAVVLVRAVVKGRRSGTSDSLLDRERTVRWIGLLNFGLALRALLLTVPEIVGYVRFGAFPSFAIVNVYWPLVVAAVSVPIGFGVRRLRPWARWAEVVLNAIAAVFVIVAAVWIWSFGEAFDIALWPEYAITRVLPFFLLLVMLLPGTGRVFRPEHRAQAAERPPGARPSVKPSALSLATLAFLVILGAVVVLNAAEWIVLYGSEYLGTTGG